MKLFIITIDTEGDNLWQWDKNSRIGTENVKFLPRFQKLCEKYGFKPVWLTNYEMIEDPAYVDFIADVEQRGLGELGMHLHAWNTPPHHNLPEVQTGLPYLIEYPDEVMRAKVETMTTLIKTRAGIQPTSHRAGRWAMDVRYWNLLKEYGYTVDCSVTPHKNWQVAPGQTEVNGTDYSNYPENAYWIDEEKTLLEVPVTVRPSHGLFLPNKFTLKSVARSGYRMLKGEDVWFRPNGNNDHQLSCFIDKIAKSDSDYLMFMLHSSELMPGGSPTFPTGQSIEGLYKSMDKLFAKVSLHFEGITLRDYYKTVAKA